MKWDRIIFFVSLISSSSTQDAS